MTAGQNLENYNNADVVNWYATYEGLTPDETYLFGKYVQKDDAILDIGVGGGRTTPFLAARTRRYIGIDYSEGMVEACRRKFPSFEFHCQDASDLKRFDNDNFDVVVFSFNGIDNIPTQEARGRCFQEVKRVLRPGGHFLFSSHNAKWIATLNIGIWRILHRLRSVARREMLGPHVKAFYKGAGYILDPIHGGLITFISSPKMIAREATAAGYEMIETINRHYPERTSTYFTAWYYYVLKKP
jgi:ubiquinone/menaquinone biosynthesis C-methylase UbiE